MSVGEVVDEVGESVQIRVKADFTENPKEPRDVIVVHADKSVEIGHASIRTHNRPNANPLWVAMDERVPISTICRDSAKQLMVIKTEDRLFKTGDSFMVDFGARLEPRDDQKGFHQWDIGLFSADFGKRQARLIMPCFDNPKHKTDFSLKIRAGKESLLFAPKLKIEQPNLDKESEKINWNAWTENEQSGLSEPVSLDDFSFDMRV